MSGDGVSLRPARPGDGGALFEVTRRSVAGLAAGHYSAEQVAGWMGLRTPAFYEDLVAGGRAVVAEHDGRVVGFVDAEPGEVTRLFLLPEAAGHGLGARLLAVGMETARDGHAGPVRVEATINAVGFYERHGFRVVGRGHFSHGLGGEPIDIVHMELPGP